MRFTTKVIAGVVTSMLLVMPAMAKTWPQSEITKRDRYIVALENELRKHERIEAALQSQIQSFDWNARYAETRRRSERDAFDRIRYDVAAVPYVPGVNDCRQHSASLCEKFAAAGMRCWILINGDGSHVWPVVGIESTSGTFADPGDATYDGAAIWKP